MFSTTAVSMPLEQDVLAVVGYSNERKTPTKVTKLSQNGENLDRTCLEGVLTSVIVVLSDSGVDGLQIRCGG